MLKRMIADAYECAFQAALCIYVHMQYLPPFAVNQSGEGSILDLSELTEANQACSECSTLKTS